ncbi:MAG: FliM/FliN family flagellar motor switch protein [Terriglobales bacterium]
MPVISPGTPQYSFVDAIRKAIADAFTQSLAASWSVDVDSDDAHQPDQAPRICFGLALSGALRGNAAIQIRQADALMLAQKLRSEEANPTSEFSAEHTQLLQTLLQKVAIATATALKDPLGAIEAQLSSIESPAWPGEAVILQASEPSAGKLVLELRFDPDLTASLAEVNPAATASPSATPETPAVPESKLDLLLGVGLSLTLRFGQRVLTLREILDLGSGSVVELDRQVQEPADLLLGDRLVARGEVVIVDGNYGVRVTEVVDPRQRIDRV